MESGSRTSFAVKLNGCFQIGGTIKLWVIAAAAFVSLGACTTAKVGVSGSLTSKGYVNRSEVALGNVYLWHREEGSARRVQVVDPEKHRLTRPSPPRDDSVSFEQQASFEGGAKLDDSQQADLLLEVARRSSVASKQLSTVGFVDPLNALLDEIRADKTRWYRSLELSDDLTFDDGVFLVLVSEVSSGQSLQVQVEGSAAAGAQYASNSVRLPSGNLKFEIVDTNKIDFTANDENGTILFARLIPYVASKGPNGVQFQTAKDKSALGDLAKALASGF